MQKKCFNEIQILHRSIKMIWVFFYLFFYLSRNPKILTQQNPSGQTQPSHPVAGTRSATQNQKRPVQQTKRF
jgi:hypothetical protein